MVDALLAELERVAPTMVGSGRPVRFASRRDELARLDYRGHPWARLLFACTLWDTDCTDARAWEHAQAAIRSFHRRGDHRGEGYGCYLLGTWAVMQGDLHQAGRWWDRAHEIGVAGPPGNEIVMAHRGLVAYAEGRLAAATALAEEAVALARLRGLPRREGTALVNVAVFRLWSGGFAAALSALDMAEDAFNAVPDPFDRYELPLCLAVRGVVWALRGEPTRAEPDLTAAVDAARTVREPLYEAIARTLRAEFTAPADPRRAGQDARWALAEFDRRGERWWRTWALQSGAVAAREAGMYTAAEVAIREVLTLDQGPLEAARSRLLLGETLLRAGRADDAVAPLEAAATAFAALDATYWSVRAQVRLGDANPDQATPWREQASRAGTTEPAFRHLLAGTSALRLTAFGPGTVLHGGQPLQFHTERAAQAVFLLALAGPHGLPVEQLADKLWTDPADRPRLLARVRTLLWDIRCALADESWRLRRHRGAVTLDLTGVPFDLTELWTAAQHPTPATARQLRRPVLTRWAYNDWVIVLHRHNNRLADELNVASSGLTRRDTRPHTMRV